MQSKYLSILFILVIAGFLGYMNSPSDFSTQIDQHEISGATAPSNNGTIGEANLKGMFSGYYKDSGGNWILYTSTPISQSVYLNDGVEIEDFGVSVPLTLYLTNVKSPVTISYDYRVGMGNVSIKYSTEDRNFYNVFLRDVSIDGRNYGVYNKTIINITNSDIIRVSSVLSPGIKIYDLQDSVDYLVGETTLDFALNGILYYNYTLRVVTSDGKSFLFNNNIMYILQFSTFTTDEVEHNSENTNTTNTMYTGTGPVASLYFVPVDGIMNVNLPIVVVGTIIVVFVIYYFFMMDKNTYKRRR